MLVVEVGKEFEILILGKSVASFPPAGGTQYAYVELDLEVIHEKGYDVIICSAVFGWTADARMNWCKRYLDFLPQRNIVLSERKELITADVYIEDSPEAQRAIYLNSGDEAQLLSIRWPYSDAPDEWVTYFDDWTDTTTAWKNITAHFDGLRGGQ